jgi:hypothetical protein
MLPITASILYHRRVFLFYNLISDLVYTQIVQAVVQQFHLGRPLPSLFYKQALRVTQASQVKQVPLE